MLCKQKNGKATLTGGQNHGDSTSQPHVLMGQSCLAAQKLLTQEVIMC